MRGQMCILIGILASSLGAGCGGDDSTDEPQATAGGAAGSTAGTGGLGGAGGVAASGGQAGTSGGPTQGAGHAGQGGGGAGGAGGAGAGGAGGAGAGGAGTGGAGSAGAGGSGLSGGGQGGAGQGGAGAGGAGAGGAGGEAGAAGDAGMAGAGGEGGPGCGDQMAQGSETCDGPDLRGQTCQTVLGMVAGGVLQCTASCLFDTSACTTCSDLLKNNQETDVDCGGGACPGCAAGLGCQVGPDCESGVCGPGGLCAAASCQDGLKNGAETDKDCGGVDSCPRCKSGEACGAATDCSSGVCEAKVCTTKVAFQTKTFATGELPSAVVVGKLNGDTHEDLLVANYGDGSVSVLLGDGKGGFAVSSFPTGPNPVSLALGDVNGDGKPDLVVALMAGVSLHLGLGDGTFGVATSLSSEPSSISVALADLDGDGDLDLVAVDQSSMGTLNGRVNTFFNNGSGAFTPQQNLSYAEANSASGVGVSDLNGDGKLDVIAGSQGDDQVRLLLNQGDGTFGSFVFFSPCLVPTSFAIADLDENGSPDVVSACAATHGVGVMLNDGIGTLAPPLGNPFALIDRTSGVVILDVDGDGHQDIAALNDMTSMVSVLVGNGHGAFVQPPGSPFSTAGQPMGLATGDFDEDGRPDLVTCNRDKNTASVFLNLTP